MTYKKVSLCSFVVYKKFRNYSGAHYKVKINSGEICFALFNGVTAGVLAHLLPAMPPIPAGLQPSEGKYHTLKYSKEKKELQGENQKPEDSWSFKGESHHQDRFYELWDW
ncbi:MAG: hypothetical protein DRH03_10850, partial [Deltaproteobacteria bacterium]